MKGSIDSIMHPSNNLGVVRCRGITVPSVGIRLSFFRNTFAKHILFCCFRLEGNELHSRNTATTNRHTKIASEGVKFTWGIWSYLLRRENENVVSTEEQSLHYVLLGKGKNTSNRLHAAKHPQKYACGTTFEPHAIYPERQKKQKNQKQNK